MRSFANAYLPSLPRLHAAEDLCRVAGMGRQHNQGGDFSAPAEKEGG